MSGTAQVIALTTAIVNAVAALVASVLWWRVEPRPIAWILLRTGQAVAVAEAAAAGILAASGLRPDNDLYWLYALLPVAVSFVAEQLRLASAETVLEQRGLPDAQAVGDLPEGDQRSIVLQIVRRELGIVTVAAWVTAFLALRAIGTV